MAKQSLEEQEAEIQRRLAPHVEGELIAAAPARAGGFLVQGQRSGGGLLGWLMFPRLMREEPGLPLTIWLALTPEDVYVFERRSAKKEIRPPLRRWRRSELQEATTKPWGKGLRVFLRLPNKKKAIFLVMASEDVRNRFASAIGG